MKRIQAFSLALGLFVFSMIPSSAFAGGIGGIGFGYGSFGLQDHLEQVLAWITGPLGKTICTLLMLYFVGMIAVKSRRNESWGGFVVGFIAVFAFLNIEGFMNQFFGSVGALM